ncbi:alpha/beta-hydrolase [Aspergillus sclerotiicarbonarius CBS 121057]|uniref:Alpha/beta-hydrolase n=1 Tax=Aspergillus sclerotiicarbonarius (strain CBS 121057 / IBT 28362) TaxID=1448318 RepID=A0A319FLB9_ASPSB|nr:alpha/beta-hydrolase [Aspergillus sclerotiicarbonarius CBS 121057]
MSHESLNPIHPSVLPHLDPIFINLYNTHMANTPSGPIDLSVLRSKYSVLYSYGTAPAPSPARVYDTTIPGHNGVMIPCRVYEPDTPGPWPVHLDFHGGGWALGDLATESHICAHIMHKARVSVIDIAYRLIPENPFPIPILDSFAALQCLTSSSSSSGAKTQFPNHDFSRISVGGVSAGANIALTLAHLARDAQPQIPLQLVVVGTPVIDDLSQYERASESPFESMQEMEFAPTLNWGRLRFFDALKVKSSGSRIISEDGEDGDGGMDKRGMFWNLLNAEKFTGLPKTVIYTAGCDPLRDEGEAYARKLVEEGGGGGEVVCRSIN